MVISPCVVLPLPAPAPWEQTGDWCPSTRQETRKIREHFSSCRKKMLTVFLKKNLYIWSFLRWIKAAWCHHSPGDRCKTFAGKKINISPTGWGAKACKNLPHWKENNKCHLSRVHVLNSGWSQLLGGVCHLTAPVSACMQRRVFSAPWPRITLLYKPWDYQ